MSLRSVPVVALVALVCSIASSVYAAEELVTKVYPVAELVVPLPGPDVGVVSIGGSVQRIRPASSEPEFEPLIERITTTIESESWKDAGGKGLIKAQQETLSLVVRQTRDVHEQIAELVYRLRRELDVQVSLEVRRLDLPENFFEVLGADIPLDEQNIVDGEGMKMLTAAVQATSRANLLSAPKVTIFNGQTIWVNDQTREREASIVLSPKVSDDRRSVKLSAVANGVRDGKSTLLSETVHIPDGHTLLIDCGETAKGKRRELIAITPRVLVLEEEEAVISQVVEPAND